MAPSSLIGNPGFGIFVTRDLQRNEKVLNGPDGISIPIVAYLQLSVPKGHLKKAWIAVWDNYWWGRGVPDHVSYEAPTDIVDYQINFGALPNHHCALDTLSNRYPDRPYTDAAVNRSDPGAGAFTYSMGREFIVTRPVAAGQELFLNYGYCQHNGDPAWTDHIFMTEDFEKAAKLIQSLGRLRYDDATGKTIVPPGTAKLVADLLPETRDQRDELMQGINGERALIKRLALKSIAPRTPEWIRDNGMCLEHMVPRKSTLPQAGKGGFAQYGVRKGEMIVPAPLLQIMDKDVLALYDDKGKNKIGDQLLMNYCFQHAESSLLLCPDTNAVLINHCSKRTNECGRGPNAAYRWSSGWDPTSDDWRKKTLEELAMEAGRGLAFEIVATRDIAPDEEVFIDYGVEWEQAWQDHVAKWKAPPPIEDFITAEEANVQGGPIREFLESGDLRTTVKHPYLMTACQYHESSADQDEAYKREEADWTQWSDGKIMDRFADDNGFEYGFRKGKSYTNHGDTSYWPCSILQKESGGTYTVRIHQNPWEDSLPWEQNDVPRILTNYPRDSIYYFVQPFASDQHLPGVFRHPIGIRDDIGFPDSWKNLKRT